MIRLFRGIVPDAARSSFRHLGCAPAGLHRIRPIQMARTNRHLSVESSWIIPLRIAFTIVYRIFRHLSRGFPENFQRKITKSAAVPRSPKRTDAISPHRRLDLEFGKPNSGAARERSSNAKDGTILVSKRTCTNEIHIHPLIKVLRSFFKSDRSPRSPVPLVPAIYKRPSSADRAIFWVGLG